MTTYTHKQETWGVKECEKRSKYAPEDAFGNKPPKGLISHVGSSYPEYGQTIRFNGGRIIEGELYDAECVPPTNHP